MRRRATTCDPPLKASRPLIGKAAMSPFRPSRYTHRSGPFGCGLDQLCGTMFFFYYQQLRINCPYPLAPRKRFFACIFTTLPPSLRTAPEGATSRRPRGNTTGTPAILGVGRCAVRRRIVDVIGLLCPWRRSRARGSCSGDSTDPRLEQRQVSRGRRRSPRLVELAGAGCRSPRRTAIHGAQQPRRGMSARFAHQSAGTETGGGGGGVAVGCRAQA